MGYNYEIYEELREQESINTIDYLIKLNNVSCVARINYFTRFSLSSLH